MRKPRHSRHAVRRAAGPIACALVLGIAWPSQAGANDSAQEARQRAADLHHQGRGHYSAGDYDEAIAAFTEAYRLSELPGILFNIGQAHRLRGDCREAVRYYRRYTEKAPESSNRPAAERHIDDLGDCAREAEAAKLDRDPDPASVGWAPEPDAGRDDSGSGKTMRRVGLGAGATGAVVLGVGAIVGLSARSASSDLDSHLDRTGGVFDSEAQRLESTFHTRRTWAIGLAAGGAALTVAGGAIYMLAGRDSGGRDGSLAISPRDGGAVLLFSGRH